LSNALFSSSFDGDFVQKLSASAIASIKINQRIFAFIVILPVLC
jgi:hypothetical protein